MRYLHLLDPARRQSTYDRDLDPEVLSADFYSVSQRDRLRVDGPLSRESDRVAWWCARYMHVPGTEAAYSAGPWWRDNATRRAPAVGMGVTKYYPNDRYPFSIVKVLTASRIIVRPDIFTRTDHNGMSESQSYEYSERVEWAHDITLTYRKTSKREGWFEDGWPIKGSPEFMIGRREAYFSPSV